MIVLKEGILIRKYSRKGIPSYIKLKIDTSNGILFYTSNTKINEKYYLVGLKMVLKGNKSNIYKKYNNKILDNKLNCFSLIFDKKILDLQVISTYFMKILFSFIVTFTKKLKQNLHNNDQKNNIGMEKKPTFGSEIGDNMIGL